MVPIRPGGAAQRFGRCNQTVPALAAVAFAFDARYRSGTTVPGGVCQEPSGGPAVAPTAASQAARPVAVNGARVRNRRDQVTAASSVQG